MTPIYRFFLLTFTLVLGCLAPDPQQQPPESPQASQTAPTISQTTRAPQSIDPSILAARAFKESPRFIFAVQSSHLPPVSERLPENPRVVIPFKQTGTYGGELRRALTGDIVQIPAVMKAKNEGLLIFKPPLGNGIEPNLAERWAFQDSGRVLILHLRKGIRWSDGHPFTAADVLFFFNDLLFNDDARPVDRTAIPPALMVNGKPVRLEKIDAHTVRFSADRPMGLLLKALAGTNEAAYPKHVFAQWHPQYTPGATYEDFRKRATRAQFHYTPGMPTLSAWMPDAWIHGQRIVFTRKPYYWKIDTEGQQLPYLDRLVFQIIPDRQVILLKFINAELDLFGRYSQIDMFHTLKEAERKGAFKVYLSGPVPAHGFYLNWDAPNPQLRDAFRNRNVRIALSLALDREEISELLYHGFLVPAGYTFYPPSPYFDEAAFKRFSEHDPDRARALLDQAGYRDTDNDGYREFPDGSRFEFTLDIASSGGADDITELATAHWEAVGLKVHTFAALRDIIIPRRYSGEFAVHYWWFDSADDPLSSPAEWAITGPNAPFWHRNADAEGPPWLREATRLLDMAATTTDTVEERAFMTRARDLYTEHIANIPLGASYRVWGAGARLGNIPNDVSFAEVHGAWGRPLTLEQIFIKP